MAAAEKFLFGRDFEVEATRPAAEETAVERAPEAETTYGEADLTAAVEEARAAAHAEGLAEGRRQAGTEADHALASATERLATALDTLSGRVNAHSERRDREQLRVAVELVQRLFPAFTRRYGLQEIEAVIRDSLDRLRDEPRVVVRVADSQLDPLKERIDGLAASTGFDGKIVLLSDEEIADDDVRVEWADGGAERDSTRLWQDIEKAVQRALGPRPAADQPAPEAETMAEAVAETEDKAEAEDETARETEENDDRSAASDADGSADDASLTRRSA